jgi:hypothetical protein
MTNQEYVRTLVINQLGDSPSYNQILQWLAENYDRLQLILDYVQTINIFEARGVWLDLIGAIVGQSREIPEAILFEYFGYLGQDNSTGYGQARYYQKGDPLTDSSILPDEEYRQVILARVARNWGDVSEVGVVEGLQNIINTQSIFLDRADQGGSFRLYIGAAIDRNSAAIIRALDIIPRAAGVGVSLITSGEPSKTFGYRDQPPGFAGYAVPVEDQTDGPKLDLNFAANQYSVWETSFTLIGGGRYAEVITRDT